MCRHICAGLGPRSKTNPSTDWFQYCMCTGSDIRARRDYVCAYISYTYALASACERGYPCPFTTHTCMFVTHVFINWFMHTYTHTHTGHIRRRDPGYCHQLPSLLPSLRPPCPLPVHKPESSRHMPSPCSLLSLANNLSGNEEILQQLRVCP